MGMSRKRRSGCFGEKQSIACGQKKTWQVTSNVKTMLIVFFDVVGIVSQQFIPLQGTAYPFDKNVLMRLREKTRKKRPENV